MKQVYLLLMAASLILFSCSDHPKETEISPDTDAPQEKGLTIVYYYDYAPYSYSDENNEMTSIIIDVLNESLGSGWAKTNLSRMDVQWVPALEDVFESLATNQADVFIDASRMTRYNIKMMGYENKIAEIPTPIAITAYHLCLRKDSPYVELLPYFDSSIREMKRDGTMDRILNRYP